MTLIHLPTPHGEVVVYVPPHHPAAAVRAFEAKVSDAWNRLGKAAPVTESTGALLAHQPAPVVPVPPKGTGTGAQSAPVRRYTGAPVAPVPSGEGPRRTDPKRRIEQYRQTLKALSQEKADLMPGYDSHAAALRSARDALKASHDSKPLFGDARATAHRIALHDRIVEACERWGPQSRRYREVTALINTLSSDLAKMEASA